MSHVPLDVMKPDCSGMPKHLSVASLSSSSVTTSQMDTHMAFTKRKQPDFSLAFDLIGRTDTKRAARAMLLTAVRWCNFKTGIIYVSIEKWAGLAGVNERTAQRAIRSLVAKGLLSVVKPSRGGPRQTTHYRVECILTPTDPPACEAPQPNLTPGPITPAPATENPGTEDAKPRSHATGTTNEQPIEQPTTHAVGVRWEWEKLMGSTELLGHPNATEERVKWILNEVRVNASIKNKSSWAAKAIRAGFVVPESINQPRRMMKPGTAEVN